MNYLRPWTTANVDPWNSRGVQYPIDGGPPQWACLTCCFIWTITEEEASSDPRTRPPRCLHCSTFSQLVTGCAAPNEDTRTTHDTDHTELRPAHYGGTGTENTDPNEPWKIIRALKMGFFQGNALKYLLRAGRVGGPAKRDEDIDKAITYLREWKRNGDTHQ